MKYILQHRYQDSGWEILGEEFDSVDDAVQRAAILSRKSIIYGMVRVVDDSGVIITFPAGCSPYQEG